MIKNLRVETDTKINDNFLLLLSIKPLINNKKDKTIVGK